jgi:hypothetical protein
MLIVWNVNAQDSKDVKAVNTKMDSFVSKTGQILKFVDYSLPNLKIKLGIAETKVRKVISGGETKYFYSVSYKGQYDTKSAYIADEDLTEVIKAVSSLKSEAITDAGSQDYIENKFVTVDEFQVGYYVSDGKVVWFMVLEKYGSGNTIFINDISLLESAFDSGKQKLEELKR